MSDDSRWIDVQELRRQADRPVAGDIDWYRMMLEPVWNMDPTILDVLEPRESTERSDDGDALERLKRGS